MLEAITELGLTAKRAGVLIGITSSSRILKSLQKHRESQAARNKYLSAIERHQIVQDQKSMSQVARLNALMIVSNAYGANQIEKRNLIGVDDHITCSVRVCLKKCYPHMKTLLYKEVVAKSAG